MYFRMKSPPLINVIQPVRAGSVPPSDSESVEIKKKLPTIAMKRHGDDEYMD